MLCDQNKASPTTNQEQNELINKYPIGEEILDSLIITPQGNYYKLIPDGLGKFKIEWGNSSVKKISKAKYHLLTAETIRFEWESKEFIVLHNEFSKIGRYDYFLSLTGDSSEYLLENVLLYDTTKNLVVREQPLKETPIVLENYITKKTQGVVESQMCDAILIEFCLDSITLKNDTLYYKLGIPRREDKNRTIVERKISVEI